MNTRKLIRDETHITRKEERHRNFNSEHDYEALSNAFSTSHTSIITTSHMASLLAQEFDQATVDRAIERGFLEVINTGDTGDTQDIETIDIIDINSMVTATLEEELIAAEEENLWKGDNDEQDEPLRTITSAEDGYEVVNEQEEKSWDTWAISQP